MALRFEKPFPALILLPVTTRPVKKLRLQDACQCHWLHVPEEAIPQLELAVDGQAVEAVDKPANLIVFAAAQNLSLLLPISAGQIRNLGHHFRPEIQNYFSERMKERQNKQLFNVR